MKWMIVLLSAMILFMVACTVPANDFVLDPNPCTGLEDADTCYINLITDNQTFTCPLIQSDVLRSICYVEAVKSNPQEEYCNKVSKSDRASCYANLGIALSDISFCEMSDGSSKEYCKAVVFIETKELEKCDSVDNAVWKDRCIDYFGRLTQDKTLCFKVSGSNIRDACIYNVSLSLGDVDLCNSIFGPSANERFDSYHTTFECVTDVAVSSLDAGDCDVLEGNIERSACVFAVAKESSDIGLCDKISFEITRDKCYNTIQNQSEST